MFGAALVLSASILLAAATIARGLHHLARETRHMTAASDRLAASTTALVARVGETVGVAASAVVAMDGIAAALRDAGTAARDAGDNTAADALDLAAGNLAGVKDSLATAITRDGIPPEPVPVTISITPTSITGTAGSDVSGQFTATGGAEPYEFTSSGDVADITVNSDGSFSGSPADAETGSLTVVATDANGVVGSVSVSVSIAAAG